MSEATQSSLMSVSSSALCSRLASRWRSCDLRLAIAGQLAQLADRLGRHEVRLQQPGLSELAQPRRIRQIGLAPRDLLDVASVDQHQLEVVLEHVPDRLPIHAGRLHHHLRDPVRGQPVTQRQQPRAPSSENSAMCGSRPPPAAGTRTHAVTCALCTSSAAGRSTIASITTSSRSKDEDAARGGLEERSSLTSVLLEQQSGVPGKAPTPN